MTPSEERIRLQTILTSPAGVKMPKLAETIGISTDLSAADAIAILEAAGEDHDLAVAAATTKEQKLPKVPRSAEMGLGFPNSTDKQAKSDWGGVRGFPAGFNAAAPRATNDHGWDKAKSYRKM